MKKILIILILILSFFFLYSCSDISQPQSVEKVINDNDSMFIIVEECYCWRVVYHKETKVMYTVSMYSHNCGNFTLLVDSNGDPLLYQE